MWNFLRLICPILGDSYSFGDDATFGFTSWIRKYFNIGSVDKCSGLYTAGGWATIIIPSPQAPIGLVVKGGKAANKASKVKTIEQSAAELLKRNGGKNRVEISSPNGRFNVDLGGRTHYEKSIGNGVPTPHTMTQTFHRIPAGKDGAGSIGSATKGPTTSATHGDLRIVRKYLESKGK